MEGSFETRERDTDVPVGVPAVVRLHTSPRFTRVTSSFETDDRGDRSGGGGGILVPPTESSRGGEVWFTYKRHRVVFVIDFYHHWALRVDRDRNVRSGGDVQGRGGSHSRYSRIVR